jgi:Asp-tRNA(Asn)/Glu-tRNA(Gln) amidotransferase C subunit
MKKNEVSVKSNGLRNELKEIRKSIDKLTNAMIEIHIAQTNTHEINNAKYCTCGSDNRVRDDETSESESV